MDGETVQARSNPVHQIDEIQLVGKPGRFRSEPRGTPVKQHGGGKEMLEGAHAICEIVQGERNRDLYQ